MSGTNRSNQGWFQITGRREPLRGRVAVFVLFVALGAAGIAWIHTNLWQRMHELEKGFGAVRTERFYHGVHLRQGLLQLNQTLLEYHLDGKREDLVRFLDDARLFKSRLETLQAGSAPRGETMLYGRISEAYQEYLRRTDYLQKRSGLFGPSRRQVGEVHETLDAISQPIFDHCGQLIEIQRREFAAFLLASQSTLDSFQSLLKLSIALLIALAVLVVVLVYRGMLMPLRLRLSESEAAAQRQEKLAALGTLAAGLAHEIRNPLTAIKFRLFSLRKSLPRDFSEQEDTRIIEEEVHRLDRIVKDVILFARPSDPEWVLVPAAPVLEQVHHLMEPELRAAAIACQVDAPRDLWLRVDPQQLKQVLINLVQNALESIGRDGRVRLEARAGHALLQGRRQPVVVLRVTDTGKGIPPEIRERLFDPFFTTKEVGTGLGLSIAARIIDKLGGTLHYRSEINKGTTFQITLPRHLENENQPAPD